MKHLTLLHLVVVYALFVASGCQQEVAKSNSGKATNQSASAASTPTTKPFGVIHLPRQTLTVKTTRGDITVGAVIFTIHAETTDANRQDNPLESIRVNGSVPRRNRILLKKVGRGQFELPELNIEFYPRDDQQICCVALKAWFNQLTNQEDSFYYVDLPSRYSLLSFCLRKPAPEHENARYSANRVATIDEFKQKLAQPFVIALNDRPLRPEYGHWPMINNEGHPLSREDLRTLEEIVRDKGERFIIAISANGHDKAFVATGESSVWEGTRRYNFVRREGAWEIEKIENDREYGW